MKGRRQFLRDAIYLPPLIAALFVAPLMISCGDDGDDEDPPPASGEDGGISGAIGTPFDGHSVFITQVQLDTPTELNLTLSGGTHTHTLNLTAPQVQEIALGNIVQQSSSNTNIHTHLVTFN